MAQGFSVQGSGGSSRLAWALHDHDLIVLGIEKGGLCRTYHTELSWTGQSRGHTRPAPLAVAGSGSGKTRSSPATPVDTVEQLGGNQHMDKPRGPQATDRADGGKHGKQGP